MTDYHRLLSAWANGLLRAASRVRKMGPRWYVSDIEKPGELLHGPSFVTKREAMAYADVNALAVLERLKQDAQGTIVAGTGVAAARRGHAKPGDGQAE